MRTDVYYYLASPFSHKDEEIREQRMERASSWGLRLVRNGLNVFCPITQSFHLEHTKWNDSFDLRNDEVSQITHEEWMRQDLCFISKSNGLLVLMLDGWKESKGVQEEIKYAEENNLGLIYIAPSDKTDDVIKKIEKFENMQRESTYIKERRASYKESFSTSAYWNDDKGNIVKAYANDPGVTLKVCSAESLDESVFGKTLSTKEEKLQKPDIMNFPWNGFGHGDNKWLYKNMDDLIENYKSGQYLNDPKSFRSILLHIQGNLKTKLIDVNKVFVFGEKKHGFQTYKKYTKEDIGLLINALGRHILKGVNNLDEESGLSHREHAMANLGMLFLIVNNLLEKV